MKTAKDREVNAMARKINREVATSSFGDRYSVRQAQKANGAYYLYEMCDKVNPENNRIVRRWLSYYNIVKFNDLVMELNDFIVEVERKEQNI